jgi:hypothetical protein
LLCTPRLRNTKRSEPHWVTSSSLTEDVQYLRLEVTNMQAYFECACHLHRQLHPILVRSAKGDSQLLLVWPFAQHWHMASLLH